MTARTLYDKIWDEHVVHTEEDGTAVLVDFGFSAAETDALVADQVVWEG